MSARYFVTGIGTDVGKTVFSAVLTSALDGCYWKPVQAGSLERTDSDEVREWLGEAFEDRILPETYRLKSPLSPHAAARLDGIRIDLPRLTAPATDRPLVIEGAGGLFVPLNDHDLVVDLIQKLEAQVIVVSRHYLGSINHTLLTLDALSSREIPVAGVVFVGNELPETERAILSRSGGPFLIRLPEVPRVDAAFIEKHAQLLRERLAHAKLV